MFTSRRHIVEGRAGSGKSTLLQWIAVQSARGAFGESLASWNNTTPFFIRLRACTKDGFPKIEDFPEYLDEQLGGKPEHWVNDQFDSHRAIILLDGMDEVPQALRPVTLKGIQRLVRNYPAARYIISSRPAAIDENEWPEWREWVEKEHFVISSLEPMNDGHLSMFITHWHNALKGRMSSKAEEDKLQKGGQELPGLLDSRGELKNLARTPLLAAMICAMNYELNGHLPEKRNELYRVSIDMLVLHRDERRGIMKELAEYPTIDKDRRLQLLRKLAVWMLRSGKFEDDQGEQAEISREEAERQFAEFFDLIGDDTSAAGARRLFVERTALLREKSVGQISFTHKTFQEYLAALLLANEPDQLLENCENDNWREVIILAVGEMRDVERATSFIKDLVAKAKKKKRVKGARRRMHLLALACLETTTVSGELRRTLIELAEDVIPLKSEEEARLIARAGKDVIPLLAYNESHDEDARVFSIQALAAIGDAACVDVLAGYPVGDVSEDINLFRYSYHGPNTDRELFLAAPIFIGKKYAEKVLSRLRVLSLDNTQVSDAGLKHLADLASLQTLNLENTQVSDAGLKHLANLASLQYLWLDNTQVSNAGLKHLANLASLQYLWLDNTQVSDAGLKHLADLASLQQLWLQNTQVSDAGLKHLADLASLQSLVLNNTQVSDAGLKHLAGLSSLQTLYLSNTQVSDAGLKHLANLASLQSLWLDDTQVSDAGLKHLANLASLQELYLNNTQVSAAGVKKLKKRLPKARIVR